MRKPTLLRVAVPTPLRRSFDYLPPANIPLDDLQAGMRLIVPFGKQRITAVLLSIENKTDVPKNKLRRAFSLIDNTPIIPKSLLDWMTWMATYYHHPIGDVIFSGLPSLLRQGRGSDDALQLRWCLKPQQSGEWESLLSRAPKQLALANILAQHSAGLSADELDTHMENWRTTMSALAKKDLIEQTKSLVFGRQQTVVSEGHPSNEEHRGVVDAMLTSTGRFHCHLLDGVTGSGKTEVYINVIRHFIDRGEQALVLVPEIGLTPQFIQRFQTRFNQKIALLHSGMTDSERLLHWTAVAQGEASILIGTRSALFTPFQKLGVIVVDEEHDNSFKQQDGFRYSARDMAVVRAKRENALLILGSATPSLESLHNVNAGLYQHQTLHQRAGKAAQPQFHVIDLKGQQMLENLSLTLINTMKDHLAHQNQVLLFLNRRGFAPSLICHECAWVALCQRCELPMTIHNSTQRLHCHHCGGVRAIPRQCPECANEDIKPRGYGTERVESLLQNQFAKSDIIRIDRDTTRKKNSLHQKLEQVKAGKNQVMLGTQMLAKGHDFPNVTLVGILDADQGLYGTDFRALEKLAQLITQVAGRAGRATKPGQVIIQTHYPDHPLLRTLINEGYAAFAQQALLERELTLLPPYTYSVLIGAESTQKDLALQRLRHCASELEQFELGEVQVLGPSPSPIEKRAGRYRAQLLLLASQRKPLHQVLDALIPLLEKERKIRWSVDVDPIDMS